MTSSHHFLYKPIRLCSQCKFGHPYYKEIKVEMDGKEVIKRVAVKGFAKCSRIKEMCKIHTEVNTVIVPVEFADICPFFKKSGWG